MKFIKMSLFVVVGLVVVVLVVAGGVLASFDTDQYETMIGDEVKKTTGRELSVGDIQMSLFPWLGFEVQQLSLSNAAGFDAPYMVQVERVDAHVEIMALFKGEVRLDTVQVNGLQLFLGKSRQGATSWDDILQKFESPDAGSMPLGEGSAPGDVQDGGSSSVLAVRVKGVVLKDARVQWDDALSGQSVLLQQINLKTGAIEPGVAVPVSFSTDMSLSEAQAGVQTNVKLDLDAQIKADLEKQLFNLSAVVLGINVRDKSLPGGKVQADIKTDVVLDLNKQTARIKTLNIQSTGLELQAQVEVSDLMRGPRAKGSIDLRRFNPSELVKTLGIALPVMASQQVLSSASMNLSFSASETAVHLKPVLVKFDESTLKGELKLNDFATPRIGYTLALDQINLDDYLPPVEKAAKAQGTPEAGKADIPIDLPVAMLRDLNVKGALKVGRIQVAEQKISNLQVSISAKAGLINIKPIKADVLEGSLSASAQLDVRKKTPQYTLSLNTLGVNADGLASPMLQKMSGKKEVRISGKSNMSLDIQSYGQSVNQLMANSNGTFGFNMGRAQLYGMDSEYFVREAVLGYLEKKKQKIPEKWRKEYQPKETTALRKALATAVIRKGVIDNQDLLIDSKRFKITGAGKINLPAEALDYRVVIDVNPVKTETVFERVRDVPMPVFIRGGFAQPEVSIDSSVWRKNVGKELTADVKKDLKQKIKKEKKEKKDKLKKKLRNLFKT
ncbi:MAG TPA: AsmA family protein [Gammaproteobacteria bacterium]|nr:AsmA family protein [Gammaproteobacteria bacterium]